MTAGTKRYRITIQRRKTEAEGLTRGASGKADYTLDANWTTHASRWAEIVETAGREYQQEGQVRGEATHLVTVEFDSKTRQATSGMRIHWDDGGATRILQVTRLLGDSKSAGGARRDLVMECKEYA